jgi:hypothetical protein
LIGSGWSCRPAAVPVLFAAACAIIGTGSRGIELGQVSQVGEQQPDGVFGLLWHDPVAQQAKVSRPRMFSADIRPSSKPMSHALNRADKTGRPRTRCQCSRAGV